MLFLGKGGRGRGERSRDFHQIERKQTIKSVGLHSQIDLLSNYANNGFNSLLEMLILELFSLNSTKWFHHGLKINQLTGELGLKLRNVKHGLRITSSFWKPKIQRLTFPLLLFSFIFFITIISWPNYPNQIEWNVSIN